MPTYVYECRSCNTVFEADQSIKDDPLDTCACGAVGTVKRVIQPVGISFKGSGFYVNDSRAAASKPESEKPDAEKPAEKPADKPADKPAETPAAATAPAAPAKTETP